MTSDGEAVSRNPMMQLGGRLGDWPDDSDMQFVDRLTAAQLDAHRVRLTCLTNAGETCIVILTACGQDVVRLTLVPDGEQLDPEPRVPILVTEQLERVEPTLEEDDARLRVSFGVLEVVIEKQPWEFRLLNADGHVVVGEHRADTNLRGWRRASWLGYARDDGPVAATFEALALPPNEHIYGLGEKFMPLDRRGQRIESWNFNTWGATNERAYKNIPFFVSIAGYGVFLNTTFNATWDFGSGATSSISSQIETEDDRLDLFFLRTARISQTPDPLHRR